MTITSETNIRKIKLVRNKIISLDSVNSMKATIKTMLRESEQESPDGALDGAIKVVTLIDTCIEILKSKGFYYKQTDLSGRPIIHDTVSKDFAILDIKYDDNDELGIKLNNSTNKIKSKITKKKVKGNGRYDHVIKNGSKKISVQTNSKRTSGKLDNVQSVKPKSKRASKEVVDINEVKTNPTYSSKKLDVPLVKLASKRTSKKCDDKISATRAKQTSSELPKQCSKDIFDSVDIPSFPEKLNHIAEFIYPFSFKKDFIDVEFPKEQSPCEEFEIAKLDHLFVNPFAEIYGDVVENSKTNNVYDISSTEVGPSFHDDAIAVNSSIPPNNSMQLCTENEIGQALDNTLSEFESLPYWANITNFSNIDNLGIDSSLEVQNAINVNNFNLDTLTNNPLSFNENTAINNAINFNFSMNQTELENGSNMVNFMNGVDDVLAYQMENFMGALTLSNDNNLSMLNTGDNVNDLSGVFMPTIVHTDTNISEPMTSDNFMDIDMNTYINDMNYGIDEFNIDSIIPSDQNIGIDTLSFNYDDDIATSSGYTVNPTVVSKNMAPKAKAAC